MKKVLQQKLLLPIFVFSLVYLFLLLAIKMGIVNNYWQGILIIGGIHVMLAVSLNITAGFLGSLALGHAGFMAIGAYASAFFSKNMALVANFEFLLACLVGGFLAMLVGFLVCLPTLRLRGDYLAIITLAFGEIIRNVLNNMKFLGAAAGYSGIPKYTNFSWVYLGVTVTVLLSMTFVQSRQGRNVIAIREDEIAAESSGVATQKYKIIAFLFSAFFAGVAGALYSHYMGFLQPGIFSLEKSIEILVMVVLGGMGNIVGSIISAMVLTLLPELLRSVSQYRMLVYSVVLIVIMLTRNQTSFSVWFHKKRRGNGYE